MQIARLGIASLLLLWIGSATATVLRNPASAVRAPTKVAVVPIAIETAAAAAAARSRADGRMTAHRARMPGR